MVDISGVHHVAIGVKNLRIMKSFYQNILGFTEIFEEFDESEQNIMSEIVRSPHPVFGGIIMGQKSDGILLELIRKTSPVARPIRDDFRYGDIGVAKITIAVTDINQIFEKLKSTVKFCAEPKIVALPELGNVSFVYCRDPEGNLVELVSMPGVNTGDLFGGVRSIGISVTDLDRSIAFYKGLPGFNVIIQEKHEDYNGLVDEVSGNEGTMVRSCLLSAKGKPNGMVELFEVLKPRGRSIPFSANWGDFGYLQICFSCDNISGIVSYGKESGIHFLCEPKLMETKAPEKQGEFVYALDPDGIPIEFLNLPAF